jgi:hypothetical protein
VHFIIYRLCYFEIIDHLFFSLDLIHANLSYFIKCPTKHTAPPTGTTNPTNVSTTSGSQTGSTLGVVPATPPAPPDLPVFTCPRRPNLGREGRPIVLRANHFQISMPRGFVHHYDINIQPDKCPRKVRGSDACSKDLFKSIFLSGQS